MSLCGIIRVIRFVCPVGTLRCRDLWDFGDAIHRIKHQTLIHKTENQESICSSLYRCRQFQQLSKHRSLKEKDVRNLLGS